MKCVPNSFLIQDLNLIDPQRIHALEEMIEFGDQGFADGFGKLGLDYGWSMARVNGGH